MKIGILTQPLYVNYGGILQCYALQKKLQLMGHETVVLQREFLRKYTIGGAILHYAKQIVKLLLGKKAIWIYNVAEEKRSYAAKHTSVFINKYIKSLSKKCYTTDELKKEAELHQLDAIIVGSDQVWRPDYSPCQLNYFLDFLSNDSKIKRLSYAASFGTDNWMFSPELTKQCGELLRKFDAVSVRELSGIDLCKKHFDVDAVQVIDPTMLLNKEDYSDLVETRKNRGNLFCYVLDRTAEKQSAIASIANKSNLVPFENMPELEITSSNLYHNLEKCVTPPIEDWISAFMEAEMVITDSFHGCVFSIIFNKPFWVIGNKARGMARFDTLLSQYSLQDRLINPSEVGNIDVNKPIEWDLINNRRKELQDIAVNFIEKSLI